MILPENYRKGQKLETLVENQTKYSLDIAELSIFETHQQATDVRLRFQQPVLASMIKGKKIMHLDGQNPFPFLPGESILLPAGDLMQIDFPEANQNTPTKCLALTIDDQQLREVLWYMQEKHPKLDGGEWTFFGQQNSFFDNTAINQIIQRLIFLIIEDHESKDLFVQMMLRELLIRMLKSESQKNILTLAKSSGNNHRLAFIVNYIRAHIREKLTIKELSNKAYMSESNFYKVFKTEFGVSPVEFINHERIRLASTLLQNPEALVHQVSLECGFNSISYFNRVFKKVHQLSPGAYQSQFSAE